MTHRAPRFDNLLNLRDLGGHPTTDGAVTRTGSLLRSCARNSPAATGRCCESNCACTIWRPPSDPP